MSKRLYLDIAPAVPLAASARQTFTWHTDDIKNKSLVRYCIVVVPFGPRYLPGVVLKIHTSAPTHPTKPIKSITPDVLTPQQVAWATSIAATRNGGLGFTLRLFSPPPPSRVAYPLTLPPVPRLKKPCPPAAKNILDELKHKPTAYFSADTQEKQSIITDVMQHIATTGKQVLLVLPEKWMLNAWQAVGCVVHADLPTRQLRAISEAVQAGKLRIIIGTQKALFLPFTRLGLVVVGEEQLGTHKLWDQYPRLHSVTAASEVASLHRASLLYTATLPSVRLWHALEQKKVTSLGSLPEVPRLTHDVLAAEERMRKYLLPRKTITSLQQALRKNERVLFFYNRLGAERGTERIESILKRSLKGVRVERIDSHTRAARQSPPARSSRTLWVGTSAIFTESWPTRFDRIIWLFPEQTISYPDFRSAERALVLLYRLQELLPPGRAIHVVTRMPTVFTSLSPHSLPTFYERQLHERTRLALPPLTSAISLTIKGAGALKKALRLRQEITANHAAFIPRTTKVFGPFQPLGAPKTSAQLLLLGDASQLQHIYKSVPVDAVDIEPERIL